MKKYCFTLVLTDNYNLPAQFTIFSFLEKNKWFIEENHDIIINSFNEIDSYNKKIYLKLCKNTKFIYLEDNNKWDQLQNLYLQKTNRQLKSHHGFTRLFNKLSVFDINNYDKVFFCDCDYMFNKDIKYVFENDYPLILNLPGLLGAYKIYKEILKYENKENLTIDCISDKMYSHKELCDILPFKCYHVAGNWIFNPQKNDIITYDNLLYFINNYVSPIKYYNDDPNLEEGLINYYINSDEYYEINCNKIYYTPGRFTRYWSNHEYFEDLYNDLKYSNSIFNYNLFVNEINKYDTIHIINKYWGIINIKEPIYIYIFENFQRFLNYIIT